MGLIKDLTTKTVDQLANIQDAGYQGDPLGTDANDNYFKSNVHPYLQDLGKAVAYEKTYQVSPSFSGLGSPMFANIVDAHAQIVSDGSSSSNKALIDIKAKGDSYADVLTLNNSGYITLVGKSKNNCVLSGNVTISAGVYIFGNIKFTGNITVTGGVAVFLGCTKTAGAFSQSGSASKVFILGAEHWSYIAVTGNSKEIYIKRVDNIAADSGKSISLESSMTSGVYVFHHIDMEGTLDEGTAATSVVNVNPNVTPLPTF